MMSDAYKFVRENNIDHKISFNSMKIQLPKTITEQNTVYFGPKSFVLNLEGFQCKVRSVIVMFFELSYD